MPFFVPQSMVDEVHATRVAIGDVGDRTLARRLADLEARQRAFEARTTVRLDLLAEQGNVNAKVMASQSAAIDRLTTLVVRLIKRLRNLPNPGPISLSIAAENQNMLTFKLNLPTLPAEPNDIVSGELTVKIGEADAVTISTDKSQSIVEGLKGNQGDTVTVSLSYLDDATPPNKSVSPSTLSVVLADTIPPADPGVLSLEVTGEE